MNDKAYAIVARGTETFLNSPFPKHRLLTRSAVHCNFISVFLFFFFWFAPAGGPPGTDG